MLITIMIIKQCKKIALCEVLHYNYILVIGKKEVNTQTISVRNEKLSISFENFIEKINK